MSGHTRGQLIGPAYGSESSAEQPDWFARAVEIVDRWEEIHRRRLLGTTDAARLAEVIAQGLQRAYEEGYEAPRRRR